MAQYTLGVTSQSDWDTLRASRKSLGTPWIEFIMPGYFSMLAASDFVKDYPNVAEALTLLKVGVQDIYYLGGFSRIAPTQRLIVDSDANGNGAYAGYPITTRWGWITGFKDKATFCGEGDWPWWHEMGHNFQYLPWAIQEDGDGEVTNNLFAFYNSKDKNLCGKTDANIGYDNSFPRLIKAFYDGTLQIFLEFNMKTMKLHYFCRPSLLSISHLLLKFRFQNVFVCSWKTSFHITQMDKLVRDLGLLPTPEELRTSTL